MVVPETAEIMPLLEDTGMYIYIYICIYIYNTYRIHVCVAHVVIFIVSVNYTARCKVVIDSTCRELTSTRLSVLQYVSQPCRPVVGQPCLDSADGQVGVWLGLAGR